MTNHFEQADKRPPPLQRKKEEFLATPLDSDEVHRVEAEYEEILPGHWQKVPGTEKDYGRASESDIKRLKK